MDDDGSGRPRIADAAQQLSSPERPGMRMS